MAEKYWIKGSLLWRRRLFFFPVLLIIVLFARQGLFAQTDTEFWFVAPEVTEDHYWAGGYPPYLGGEPIFFNFTTLNLASTVTISMPANPGFPDTTFTIPANTTTKPLKYC